MFHNPVDWRGAENGQNWAERLARELHCTLLNLSRPPSESVMVLIQFSITL